MDRIFRNLWESYLTILKDLNLLCVSVTHICESHGPCVYNYGVDTFFFFLIMWSCMGVAVNLQGEGNTNNCTCFLS